MPTIKLAPQEYQPKNDPTHVAIDYDGRRYSVSKPLVAKNGYPFGGVYQIVFDTLYPGRFPINNDEVVRLDDDVLRSKWDELARQLGVLRSGVSGLSPGEWLLEQLNSGLHEFGDPWREAYVGGTDISAAVAFFQGVSLSFGGSDDKISLDTERILNATPETVVDPPVWNGSYDSISYPEGFDFRSLLTVSQVLKAEYAHNGLDAETVYAFLLGMKPAEFGPSGEPIIDLNGGRRGYRPYLNGKDDSGGLGAWVITSGPVTSGQDATHGLGGEESKQ